MAVAPSVSQVLTGNDSDGTTKITVNWTSPGVGYSVKVYRKGFGHYPEYDDAGGAVPTLTGITTQAEALAAGWTLAAGVDVPGENDEPATRDFWYYIAFVENACGGLPARRRCPAGSSTTTLAMWPPLARPRPPTATTW